MSTDRLSGILWTVVLGMFAALAVVNAVTSEWLALIVDLVYVFAWSAFVYMRRQWLRIGWQRGRREMIMSMHEAQVRGLSAAQWLIAETERTELGAVIFLPRDDES